MAVEGGKRKGTDKVPIVDVWIYATFQNRALVVVWVSCCPVCILITHICRTNRVSHVEPPKLRKVDQLD